MRNKTHQPEVERIDEQDDEDEALVRRRSEAT